MPKRINTLPQPTLFHRDIPKMPEGYYSSGPNPNLHRFVEEHATPYDPATDDYNVPPFDQPITTTKATAIYNMHSYHQGKKPHDAIQQYIRHYTKPGELVLDTFSGSGSTALASLIEERSVIAIDLAPAATFVTKTYCTPLDTWELEAAFIKFKSLILPEMNWLYETRCDRCDGKAILDFTVFSFQYICPRCLNKVSLFDCIDAKGMTKSGKPKDIHACPICYANGTIEEISTRAKRFPPVPVLVSYKCEDGCKPVKSQRRHNDENSKKREYFAKYDLGKIAEIKDKTFPYTCPDYELAEHIPYRMLYKIDFHPESATKFSDLYTRRNLWAICLLIEKIKTLVDPKYTHVLQASVTGVVRSLSKMQRYYPEASFPDMSLPGMYYIPPIFSEENALQYFENKFKRNIKGVEAINKLVKKPSCIISTQSATDIHQIPDSSIDYIYTDPPYSDSVQYGELNFIWEAWLGFNLNWRQNEIIVNDISGKSEAYWAAMMKDAFSECYRVLKPGRALSLCYHDTSEGTWQLVQDILAEAGFVVETIKNTLYIETEQKSYNQYVATKVNKRDLVINFRKPREGEIAAKVLLTGEEDPSSFSEKAQLILRESLNWHPGTSADRLYDELVSRMVRKGQFQRHNFDELLRTVAEEMDGRWYLLETADKLDDTETKKEVAAAAKLEAFMQKFMKANPGEYGVHYSNLFEEYLPVSDKPRRLMQDWLPEFFFKTEDGTWRPPANDEERQAKLNLRLTGELRHIKRFANALSAGVPPANRDRPSNAATLAAWIYQCRRSGLYDIGRVLYERGGMRFDGLKEEQQMQVEEDYQICVKRGSSNEPKKAKKKQQPTLFDQDES